MTNSHNGLNVTLSALQPFQRGSGGSFPRAVAAESHLQICGENAFEFQL